MHHLLGTILLVVVAVFFLFTAWGAGFAPKEFARTLGLTLASADGYNEIRAQYAGFFLASACMCIAALAGGVSRQPVFILLAVTFGGLIAGRLTSLVLNRGVGGYGRTILALYAIDATGFALAIAAILADRRA